MIATSAFTVFVLGLRHGADPDHLAAIDNVTRNAFPNTPKASRWAGTLFALGHTVMVLAISALVGLLGARFVAHGALVETIGGWVSVVVLLTIAVVNIRGLLANATRIAGVKTRLLPRALRESGNVLLAIPIGLLFGFGFETSSQIATYAVAFGADAGLLGAVLVGAMFCVGMICTDTLDSVLVHRLVSFRSTVLPRVMRVWVLSVSLLAVAVATYECAQLLGWRSPVSDLALSIVLVAALAGVFLYVFVSTHAPPIDDEALPLTQGERP